MIADDPVAHALARHPAFARAREDELTELASGASIIALKTGESFFKSGELAEFVYVLVDGVLRVFHSEGTEQITVKHLPAPATFGEMEVIAGKHYLEDAEAMTDCRAVRVHADAFVRFISKNQSAAWSLLQDVCARFCVAARNERLALAPLPSRLASLLLEYSDLFGQRLDDGLIVIRRELSLDTLARGLGATRRSVTRSMSSWRDGGIVDRHKGWLRIIDRAALEALAGDNRHHLNHRLYGRGE